MSKARQLADLGNVYDDGALSNRNLIINGAMQVAQRGTSVTGLNTTIGYFTVDRFRFADAGSPTAVFTQSQDTNAPDGFATSLKMLVTTIDASVAATTQQYIDQFIEAQNLQQLAWNTASSGKVVTLSFYVKCSTAQTFAIDFVNEDNSRYFNTTYTVDAADTWERKTITIPADASNGFNNDDGRGLRLRWTLVAGTNYTTGSVSTTWSSSSTRASGHENTWVGTTSNYWQITGVQLEVGDTATPFEHRSYGDELARCQRYYQRYVTNGYVYGRFAICENRAANKSQAMFDLGQAMRAVPTLQTTGTASNYALYNSEAIIAATALTYDSNPTARVPTIQVSVASGLVDGGASQLMANNNASSYIAFDAEL